MRASPDFVTDRFEMYLLNRMSKRPRMPSEILNLKSEGIDPAAIYDFDRAVEIFDMQIEARAEAMAFVDKPKDPPKGKTWGKKYRTIPALLGMVSEEEEEERQIKASLDSSDQELIDRLADSDDALEAFFAEKYGADDEAADRLESDP